MEVSLYLKRAKATTETAIFARISYSGYQMKYYIPEKINPKYWNKETQKAKQIAAFSEYPEFNQRLKNITSTIQTVFRKYANDNNGKVLNPETFKILLDSEIKKKENENDVPKSFFAFFQDMIDQTESGGRMQPISGKPFSKATIQIYKNTLNRLTKFQVNRKRKIDFNSIDLDFYTDFVEYLSKRLKLASNTIGKDIKTLKTILNEATERGLNTNLLYKSKKFSTTSEQTDSIYLDEEELIALEALDLSKDIRLDNIRDTFIIGAYSGLRFSDIAKLTLDKMDNGVIKIKQIKTDKKVEIPIHNSIKRVLDKYNGQLPKIWNNPDINESLKVIGEKIPLLHKLITKTMTKG